MSASETWIDLAKTLGYQSETDMWKDLYERKDWSIGKIAIRLGYSNTVIRRRMALCSIKMRGKGGPNNKGKGKKILDRFDLDFVMNAPVKTVLDKAKVTESTLWRYRRDTRRKQQQPVTDLPDQSGEGA